MDKLEAVTASDVYGGGSVAPFMSVFLLSLFHLYKILWNNALRVMSANQRQPKALARPLPMKAVSGWGWCPARSCSLRGKQEESWEGWDGSVEILEPSSLSSSGMICSF